MQKKKIIILFLITIILILIIIFLYTFRNKILRILNPIFIAFVIAYLVNPLVQSLQRKKIPCSLSIILVYLFIIFSFAAILIYIIPELINNTKELIITIPDIVSSYQDKINNTLSSIRSSKWSPDIKEAIFNEIDVTAVMIQNYTVNLLRNATSKLINSLKIIIDFILALVIAFYFIRDSQFFKSQIISLVPKKWKKQIIQTGRDMDVVLSNFIKGQLLTAIIVGVLEFIGLVLINVKYSMVLGIIGGVAEVIPYFGPIIGAIPAVAIALVDSPIKALWTIFLFAAVQQIENVLISPRIIEGKVGLHPFVTLIAVLAGGEFLGIIGMIISVPLVAITKVLFKRIVDGIV